MIRSDGALCPISERFGGADKCRRSQVQVRVVKVMSLNRRYPSLEAACMTNRHIEPCKVFRNVGRAVDRDRPRRYVSAGFFASALKPGSALCS